MTCKDCSYDTVCNLESEPCERFKDKLLYGEMEHSLTDCKHYDTENGWCKFFTDWHDAMPDVEYCLQGPCSHYEKPYHEMTIKTKYKVGDTVWFANYFCDEFYPYKYSGNISEIFISVTDDGVSVLYLIAYENEFGIMLEKHSEDVCFGSYEECVKWCNKQN